jgi:thioredoxin-like negative regulator of GroEL
LDNDRQIRFFQQQFENNPDSLFMIPLADLYLLSGDSTAALDLLKNHKHIVESNVSAMTVLGKCYLETDQKSSAIKLFKKVLSKDSQNTIVDALLQDSLKEIKASEAVIVDQSQDAVSENNELVTEIKPTFVTMTIADIYFAQGHKNKALEILNRILDESPDREDVRDKIAKIEGL